MNKLGIGLGASSVISLDPKIETPVFWKMQNEFDSSDLMLFQLRHRYCTCQSCLSSGCPVFLPSPCRCVFFGVHLQVASSAIPSRRLRRRWLRSMVGWWWVSGSYDIILRGSAPCRRPLGWACDQLLHGPEAHTHTHIYRYIYISIHIYMYGYTLQS